jgi:Sec-independent protein translocase protein TatA
MPDWQLVVNGGLVAVLGLLVLKLPEICRVLFDYLRERQTARDKEVERLMNAFLVENREDRERTLAAFKEQQELSREQAQEQFVQLLAAVEKRQCGFMGHHQIQTVPPVPPPATVKELRP